MAPKKRITPLGRLITLRTLGLLGVYAVIFGCSLSFAFLLRFDFEVPLGSQRNWLNTLSWLVPLKLAIMYAFGQYSGLLSYFRLPDLYRVAGAQITAAVIVSLGWLFLRGYGMPPRGVILADLMFSFFFLCTFRTGLRILRERYLAKESSTKKPLRVAIMGAGDAGAAIASDLLARRAMGMRPVVFMDDDPEKQGHYIHGIPVVGTPADFKDLVDDYLIDKVIIAMASAANRRIREIIQNARNANLPVDIIPSLRELATGQVKATQIRPVELGDLLGREQVCLDSGQIDELVQDKVVLVTGAGGSIGGELCRQILSRNPRRLLMIDQSEVQLFQISQEVNALGYGALVVPLVADIIDGTRMDQILERNKPQIIFHAAAHKHVPMMESQPGEAIKNNTLGTAAFALIASHHHIERFVLISTDKAINPTSVMGVSKRLAELCIQGLQQNPNNRTRFMAVRFGNVLGSSGSVIPVFKKQIAEGGPVTVTHPNVTRYFMTIPEAVGLVLQTATLGEGGAIYVLDMGEPIKIVDVARQLIELSGFKPDLDIEIKYVGLRPGEKMFEELKHTGEDFAPTSHPRIIRFSSTAPSYDELENWLEQLNQAVENNIDRNAFKTLIQSFVPEYTPYFE
jgi:FlaA1/EpsC-like NDP-sugar epimerase